MRERADGGSYGVPRLDENGGRALIAKVRAFLKANPANFTVGSAFCDEISGEAERLSKALHFAGKALIRQGGKVPPLLEEIETLNEELTLRINSDHSYKHEYTVLAQGNFKGIQNVQGRIGSATWLALRGTTNLRRIERPEMSPRDYHSHRGQRVGAEIFEATRIFDVLHLQFPVFGSEDPKSADLGWVGLGTDNSALRDLVNNRRQNIVEGLVWDAERLAEVARRRSGYKLSGNLSLIIGEPVNRLRRGYEASFFDKKISFGQGPDASPQRIGEQVRSNVGVIGDFLSKERRGQNIDDFVRGGRPGLNPSRLYLDAPRR